MIELQIFPTNVKLQFFSLISNFQMVFDITCKFYVYIIITITMFYGVLYLFELNCEKLYSLYRSSGIVRVIKTRILGQVGHVARMEEGRRAFKSLTDNHTGKIPQRQVSAQLGGLEQDGSYRNRLQYEKLDLLGCECGIEPQGCISHAVSRNSVEKISRCEIAMCPFFNIISSLPPHYSCDFFTQIILSMQTCPIVVGFKAFCF